MKAILPVCALSLAVSLSAFAAPPNPVPAAGQPASPVCAVTGDQSKYCDWNNVPFGTDGRECRIDVETIDQEPCNLQASTASESNMADHAPICISAGKHEHIVFTSGKGRSYRIRRLIPLDSNPAHCQNVPQPFNQPFDPAEFDSFGTTFDTLAAKAAAQGCFYKLEVEFMTSDPNGVHDRKDPQAGRKLECRDPHLGVN